MTKAEFANIMAPLVAVTKPLSQEAAEVYFSLLGDLPAAVLKIACARVLLTHKWATFPTIAELREAAADTMRGQVAELSAGEAWAMAWAAIGKIDPENSESIERASARLPPVVFEAMKVFGINAMCYGREPVGVVRAQFVTIYEGLANRDKRMALLPAELAQQIAQIGQRLPTVGQLPKPRGVMAETIGELAAYFRAVDAQERRRIEANDWRQSDKPIKDGEG